MKRLGVVAAYIQIGAATTWLIMDVAGIIRTAMILTGTSYPRGPLMLAKLIQGVLIGFYIWMLIDGIEMIKTSKKQKKEGESG